MCYIYAPVFWLNRDGIIPLIFIKILRVRVQFPKFQNPCLQWICNLVAITVRQYNNSPVSAYPHDCLNAIYKLRGYLISFVYIDSFFFNLTTPLITTGIFKYCNRVIKWCFPGQCIKTQQCIKTLTRNIFAQFYPSGMTIPLHCYCTIMETYQWFCNLVAVTESQYGNSLVSVYMHAWLNAI